jgi:hypothetical protein
MARPWLRGLEDLSKWAEGVLLEGKRGCARGRGPQCGAAGAKEPKAQSP